RCLPAEAPERVSPRIRDGCLLASRLRSLSLYAETGALDALNYDERHLAEALAILDDDRPIVHRYIYGWLEQGAWNNKRLPEQAVAKLKQLAKTDPRAKAVLDGL